MDKIPLRRARQSDGTFKGEHPDTPVNEAWEPIEAEAALDKDIKYSVKQKVNGTTPGIDTAGKYSKKPGVRPTFGTVTTQTY